MKTFRTVATVCFTLSVLLILMSGCVGVKLDRIELQGLKEIEGVELMKWEDFTTFTLAEIEKFEVYDRAVFSGADMYGSLPAYGYEMVTYLVPDMNQQAVYLLTYIIVGDQRRVETVGMALRGAFGMAMDRYKNTDTWYRWDPESYLAQHPEERREDNSRFQRNDSS